MLNSLSAHETTWNSMSRQCDGLSIRSQDFMSHLRPMNLTLRYTTRVIWIANINIYRSLWSGLYPNKIFFSPYQLGKSFFDIALYVVCTHGHSHLAPYEVWKHGDSHLAPYVVHMVIHTSSLSFSWLKHFIEKKKKQRIQ